MSTKMLGWLVGARDGKKLGSSWDPVNSIPTLSQPGPFQTFARCALYRGQIIYPVKGFACKTRCFFCDFKSYRNQSKRNSYKIKLSQVSGQYLKKSRACFLYGKHVVNSTCALFPPIAVINPCSTNAIFQQRHVFNVTFFITDTNILINQSRQLWPA